MNEILVILPCLVNTDFYSQNMFNCISRYLQEINCQLASESNVKGSWSTSLDVSWVQLSRYLTMEHHEWNKPGSTARGQAGGGITLVWLRQASPSQCLHNYPADSAWKCAQLRFYISWRDDDDDDDVIDEVRLSHTAALTCSSWISHLCSCLRIKYAV